MAPICNAQEEIIFNKQDIDKKDIKTKKSPTKKKETNFSKDISLIWKPWKKLAN
jgi:hypothetical protein